MLFPANLVLFRNQIYSYISFYNFVLSQAHRRLVKKYHPDRNRENQKAASDKFKEVQEAYEVLSDERKRNIYDTYGDEALKPGGTSPGGFSHSNGFGQDGGDVSEAIYQMFFGGSRGAAHAPGTGGFFSQMFGFDSPPNDFAGFNSFGGRPQPSATLEATLEVSLEELYSGATKIVTVPHRIRVSGSPIAYTYKHTYTVTLKPGWKDGTSLKYPAQEITLNQIGATRLPPVSLKLKTRPHNYFERVGDDLIIKVILRASQVESFLLPFKRDP